VSGGKKSNLQKNQIQYTKKKSQIWERISRL
jgi:hypothetical protein